jgi:hypothetical protein
MRHINVFVYIPNDNHNCMSNVNSRMQIVFQFVRLYRRAASRSLHFTPFASTPARPSQRASKPASYAHTRSSTSTRASSTSNYKGAEPVSQGVNM